MKNIRLVSNDAELIARVEDALAPLDIILKTSGSFPIEGSYWTPGCLSILFPWFPEKEEPDPSPAEVRRRGQVDILILDMIREESYDVISNIRRSRVWSDIPIFALDPVIPSDIFMNQGRREDLKLLREFDPSELRRVVQALLNEDDTPPGFDGKFFL